MWDWIAGLGGAGGGALIGGAIGSLFLPGVGTAIGAGVGALAGGTAGLLEAGNLSNTANQSPQIQQPGVAPPNPATASTTIIQMQLAKEQNSLATATLLTSGAGLLDEPTTTSRTLMGA